tara:strand:- start:6844 stop:7866 length:1023 start_codon:yes stop_codon:yes gene_type:complete
MKRFLFMMMLIACSSSYGQQCIGDCNNGSGTYTSDTSDYVGDWKNSKFHGEGKLILHEVQKTIEGVWRDGEFINGKISEPGILFEGEFNDAKLNGYGKITIWEDGDRVGSIEGDYKNNKPYGDGIVSNDSGEFEYSFDESGKKTNPLRESINNGKDQFRNTETYALRCFSVDDDEDHSNLNLSDFLLRDNYYVIFDKRNYIGFVDNIYTKEFELFGKHSDENVIFNNETTKIQVGNQSIVVNNRSLLLQNIRTNSKSEVTRKRLSKCFHRDINLIESSELFLKEILEIEEQKRYDKIYNACLLDKAKGMSMEVDSVRDAVEGACENIAKNPSWLDNWKYN